MDEFQELVKRLVPPDIVVEIASRDVLDEIETFGTPSLKSLWALAYKFLEWAVK